MFRDEQEPLTLLLELSPRLAKKRYRQSIYEAWHHKCGYCGEMATSLDHIVPYKNGERHGEEISYYQDTKKMKKIMKKNLTI